MLAASVTLLLLSAPEARGLRWHAPADCPSQADAAGYLETELESDASQGTSEVQVEPTPNGWQAEVRIDGDDPRLLTAGSCEDLMAAAMVVIAVARDAQPEPAEPPSTRPEPAVPLVPTPEPPPAREPAPEAEQPRTAPAPVFSQPTDESTRLRPPFTHWVGVDAGVAAIHVPAVSARLGARYVLRGDRWAVRVAGHYETPRRLLYPGTTVGGRFSAVAANVQGCYEPGRGSVTAALCAGPAVGAVFGAGVGIPAPRRPRAVWVGAHALAGLRWAWNPQWRLCLDALLAVGLARPAFRIGDRQNLLESPRLGGAGMLGIERRLP
ncbi:MAG: hypothetical protein ACRBN8_12440 [Nannocystales bacterium]